MTDAAAAGVPFVMTAKMKAALRERGLTDAAIAEMTPADAHKMIGNGAEPDALLEPNGADIAIFVETMFRHAGTRGYVSVRAFHEGDATRPFRISATSLGAGLQYLVTVAIDDARRAAQNHKPVVFCPPLAIFASDAGAKQTDLVAGLALSVECDQRPREARETLERLLGPATVIVKSGGVWIDSAGVPHDKLHLHWRLAALALGAALPKLKDLRAFATRIVGGDPSNKPIVHPIRWPGSWHRKGEPRLCEIEALNADAEIDLDTAFDILSAEAAKLGGGRPSESGGGDAGLGDKVDWVDAFEKILTGDSYHPTLVPLASSFAGLGAPSPVAYTALRSLLLISNPQDPERQRRRAVELEKLTETVGSGYAKFGQDNQGGAAWIAIDLDLLVGAEMTPPELTHDMLPAGWVDLVFASAFSAAAPPDYTAAAMIVAAAGAIGNARIALARPGWTEAVVLWGALVGPPSAHKSPAMTDARAALTHIDKKLFAQWRSEVDRIEADYQIAVEQAAQDKKKKPAKPQKPPLPQLLYDDVTLEKLTISMSENPHGALVFYDELASWFSSFGRYSSDGDASGARAFWNKSYNAGPHKRDRVKNEGPPVYIPAAACSVVGAIQPDRLRQFWDTTNDGMLARMMFIWPRLAAVKPIDFNASQQERDDLTHKIKRAYRALYDLKLDSPDGEAQPRMLALAADARGAFNDAHLRCEEKSRRARGALAEWLGKGPGRILRLALTFEMMAWAIEPTAAEPEEISADAVGRAILFFTYLAAMFARTMIGIEPAEAGSDAIALAKFVVKRQWRHFADRDIGRESGFRWFRGESRKDKERRDNALGVLIDANAIRQQEVRTGGGVFKKWAVHPDLAAVIGGPGAGQGGARGGTT